MSLKNTIKASLKGNRTYTVGEILDTVMNANPYAVISYDSVRARVYEMANRGELYRRSIRADKVSGVQARTFGTRPAPTRAPSFSF